MRLPSILFLLFLLLFPATGLAQGDDPDALAGARAALERLNDCVTKLHNAVSQAARDSLLRRDLGEFTPQAKARMMERLRTMREEGGTAADLLLVSARCPDCGQPAGGAEGFCPSCKVALETVVRAYGGTAVPELEDVDFAWAFTSPAEGSPLVRVFAHGIYWVLGAGVRVDAGCALVGLLPLELRFPSLRQLGVASGVFPGLCRGLGGEMHVSFAEGAPGLGHVPLSPAGLNIPEGLTVVFAADPGAQSRPWVGPWLSSLFGLVLVALFALAVRAIFRKPAGLTRFALFCAALVGLRVGLALVHAPGAALGGDLFSDSPFSLDLPLGLARSAGDFLLTVCALAGLVLVFLQHVYPRLYGMTDRLGVRAKRLTAGFFGLGCVFAVPLLITLYLGSVRTVLAASRFSYFPPGRVWHDEVGTVLLVSLFLLTLCFLLVAMTLVHTIFRLQVAWNLEGLRAAVVTVLAGAGGFAFLWFGTGLGRGTLGIHLMAVVVVTYFLHRWLKQDRFSFNHVTLILLAVTLFCFPALNDENESKLRHRVLSVAQELDRSRTDLRLRLEAALDAVGKDPVLEDQGRSPRLPRYLPALVLARSGLVSPEISCHVRLTRFEPLGEFSFHMPRGRAAGSGGKGFWEHPRPADNEAPPASFLSRAPGLGPYRDHVFWTGRVYIGRFEERFYADITVAVLWPFPRRRTLSSRVAPPFGLGEEAQTLLFSQYRDGKLVLTTSSELAPGRPAPVQVRDGLGPGRRSLWVEEELGGSTVRQLVFRPVGGAQRGLMSVGYRIPVGWQYLLEFLRLAVLNFAAGAVLFLAFLLLSLPYNPELRSLFRLRFKYRLLISYVLISVLPIIVLGYTMENMIAGRALANLEEEVVSSLGVFHELLETDVREDVDASPTGYRTPGLSAEKLRRNWDDEVWYDLRSEILQRDFGVFLDDTYFVGAGCDPYENRLVSRRLPGDVYQNLVAGPSRVAFRVRRGGPYLDITGYKRLSDAKGAPFGALVVTHVLPEMDLKREVATQISLVLTLYLLTLFGVGAVGVALARRISRPMERLTAATREVAEGNLDHRIDLDTGDEIGELVTSFNRMTDALKDSRLHIIQAEKESAWREMARQIAHEIKNPLTPMRLSASHILKAHRDRHPKFDKILGEGLERIAAQVDALGKIASEFSDFARFPHANIQPNDLNDIVSKAVLLVAEEVRDADPVVTVEETYGGLPPVPVDRDEMERAVINIVKNAVQALREEGGKVSVTTRCRGEGKGDSGRRKATRRVAKTERRIQPEAQIVEVVVIDDGPGIPEEIQSRLFEPYFSTKTGGTGLGLAICKRSITEMGGEIVIESEEGVGTTVTVRLPLVAEGGAEEGEEAGCDDLPDREPGTGTGK